MINLQSVSFQNSFYQNIRLLKICYSIFPICTLVQLLDCNEPNSGHLDSVTLRIFLSKTAESGLWEVYRNFKKKVMVHCGTISS